ncbi:hypothetical protein AMTRI_Chr13g84820 [Amborella trichopoda]
MMALFLSLLLFSSLNVVNARPPHSIAVKSPGFSPESLSWDDSGQHFVIASPIHATVLTLSDAGILQSLISDPDFAGKSSLSSLALDGKNQRLVALFVNSSSPFLASYDLKSRNQRLFVAPLAGKLTEKFSGQVAVDSLGNAYVTNPTGHLIWKINPNGEVNLLSQSYLFSSPKISEKKEEIAENSKEIARKIEEIDGKSEAIDGIYAIAYSRKGYLLVAHMITGDIFRVDCDDGTVNRVLLSKNLDGIKGFAVRRDGALVAVTKTFVWLLMSNDNWAEAVVKERVEVKGGEITAVTLRGNERVYVLKVGVEREGFFEVDEMVFEEEREGENIWVFVLLGLALIYVFYWRFQMGQLMQNMNKKKN